MNKKIRILEFLSENINNFIIEKKIQNLSTNSIAKYQCVLEVFYDYCSEKFDDEDSFTIEKINKVFLNSYINFLSTKKIVINSQNNYLIIIKSFFNYSNKFSYGKYNWLTNLTKSLKIRTVRKVMPSFSQDEQLKIIKYIEHLDSYDDFLSNRNSLMLKLLLYTGLRISELINILWNDLVLLKDNDGDIYQILITGKGSVQRYTYISENLVSKNLAILNKHKDSYLFVSLRNNKCSREVLFLNMKNLLTNAKVYKTGLHIFRHTFARNLVTKNFNLSTIKELLGHSNISTTAQFYAKRPGTKDRVVYRHLNKTSVF